MWTREGTHQTPTWGFDPQHPCSVLGWEQQNTAWVKGGRFPSIPQLLGAPHWFVSQSWGDTGLECPSGQTLPLPRATNMDREVSLIHFSFLFLISFIAPGKWEVTAEGSCWQQPGGFGSTDVRGRITGAKSVGFDSAAAQRLSVCQGPWACTDVTPHSRDRQMLQGSSADQ